MTDEERILVTQFRMPASRKRAFEAIVKRYSRVLYSHLSKFCQNREDLEDLLQVVWIKAWKGLDQFRGDSKLSTWLFTIATREAYDRFRSKKRIATQELQDSAGFNSPNSLPDSTEILMLLQKAIDTLPEKQQQVFIMRYFEELTYEEMAENTGTSVGALKASYHHAVKKIELFIGQH